MAYPGLILGNAALGEGIETHMFFTFWGLDMVTKSRMSDLQFTPVGNTAMHLPVGDARMPQFLTPFPGMVGMSTKMMKKQIADLASGAKGDDKDGYRAEFVQLVKLAAALAPDHIVDGTGASSPPAAVN